jgi:hypothetical protein
MQPAWAYSIHYASLKPIPCNAFTTNNKQKKGVVNDTPNQPLFDATSLPLYHSLSPPQHPNPCFTFTKELIKNMVPL